LAAFAAIDEHIQLGRERGERANELRSLTERLVAAEAGIGSLEAQDATLAKRLAATNSAQKTARAGIAPLAAQVLKSVFTVESGTELGTAWVAWNDQGHSFLITANHVVANAISIGDRSVSLKQNGRTASAVVVKTDTTNDLALVEAPRILAAPLWQHPQLGVSPVVGDELVLVGSPFGLEGTVTSGVVSRVTYDAIQTDAAANPGNSGGPAVNRSGEVVGVLLAGGAENLNFAVPIQRACVTVRKC